MGKNSNETNSKNSKNGENSLKNEEENTDTNCDKKELSPKEEKFVQAVINNDLVNSNKTLIAKLGVSDKTFYRIKKRLKDVILERYRELFKSEVPAWLRSLSREDKTTL